MSKHAYLIIAHKEDLTFHTLLKMLDDTRNDIFLHMDKKNKLYNQVKVENSIQHSQIYHVERTNVTWGGYSQIAVELSLLQKAISKGRYEYYHLISGEDLPIKTQDYIHLFFDKAEGKEFIRFEKPEFDYKDRVRFNYFFQEKIGRGSNYKFWKIINKCSISLQKILNIERAGDICFQKGTNWFSITDDLARYVCKQKEWVKKIFKNTICCDEVFLQTLVHNSDFKNRLYHGEYDNSLESIMRLIDWKRGNPYIFRQCDFDEICQSKMLFARKFNSSVDKEIVLQIAEHFGCEV